MTQNWLTMSFNPNGITVHSLHEWSLGDVDGVWQIQNENKSSREELESGGDACSNLITGSSKSKSLQGTIWLERIVSICIANYDFSMKLLL